VGVNTSRFVGGQHLNYTRMNDLIDAVKLLEENKTEAESFESYSEMISALNAKAKDAYHLGQSIYVVTRDVPDVWISEIKNTKSTYSYVDDDEFKTALHNNNKVQVGYFCLSILETEKPNLSIYQEKSIIEYDTTNDSAAITLDTTFTNHELRYTNAVDSIEIEYDSAILEDAAFIAGLVFKTKKDTTITFQEMPTVDLVNIKYLGTDTSDGVFYPEAGVEYDMTFYFDGISLKCLVSGVAY